MTVLPRARSAAEVALWMPTLVVVSFEDGLRPLIGHRRGHPQTTQEMAMRTAVCVSVDATPVAMVESGSGHDS